MDGVDGVLVLDKPAGLSSAGAVDRVKRALGADRAGHGGTLDPIATGVLPVCLGAATKLAQYLLADDKAYEAEGVLGVLTDTLDRTGRVVAELPVAVAEAALRAALARRVGEQAQVPPAFSAIKQDGVRMYRRARAGEDVQLAPRPIRIDRLELLAFESPRFRIAVECSKGTYIRSLVADLGADVGCGAHLAELRRTRSGRFRIEDAIPLERVAPGAVAAHLVPLTAATGLPTIAVRATHVGWVRSGVQLPLEVLAAEPEAAAPAAGGPAERFQLIDEAGRLLAIAHTEAGRVVYDRVFGGPVGGPGDGPSDGPGDGPGGGPERPDRAAKA
jgi:tRNA pseudouridine55 synthase